jgi:hypothetical protein
MESSVARSHRGHWQGKVGDQHALIGQHDDVVFGAGHHGQSGSPPNNPCVRAR